MTRAIDTWIVVPCFNEADRLTPDAFSAYLATHPSTGFVFVNDGCTDDTAPVLERLSTEHPRQLRVLTLSTNAGKAEAVRQGVQSVLPTHPTAVGYWDADLATPLSEIDRLRAVIDDRADIDIVLGVRLPLQGRQIHQTVARRWMGRLFSLAASVTLGHRFRDTQCGAKLFRVTPILHNAFTERFRSRWIFDVELLLRCRTDRAGHRFLAVYEIPLETWTGRRHSKLKPWSYAWCAAELLGIFLQDRLSTSDAWWLTR